MPRFCVRGSRTLSRPTSTVNVQSYLILLLSLIRERHAAGVVLQLLVVPPVRQLHITLADEPIAGRWIERD